jgi:glutathione S-transferase
LRPFFDLSFAGVGELGYRALAVPDPAPSFVLYAAAYASVPTIQCSPPSWMAHALLEDKGADYEVRWLDFAKGEHRTEAMQKLNPEGTVPVLSEGDAVVTETLAILEYLEYRLPAPPWLPAAPGARAKALSRLHASNAVKERGMALFRARMKHAAAEAEQEAVLAELRRWEVWLGTDRWLAGAEVGLADLCVFTYFAVARRLGLPTGELPGLVEHHARMRARPAIERTWPTTWAD